MTLSPGLDFRKKEYRRETFLRFYEFHLRYKSHPGGVYYLIPFLRERYKWDDEQTLFFCFLNGNTQNPVTSWLLFNAGKDDLGSLKKFYEENYGRLQYDTDRRHHKPFLMESLASYYNLLGDYSQKKFLDQIADGGFSAIWDAATSVYTFGRLSAFSYSEYLKIAGVKFDCDTLFLHDMSGSKSHRNGLCIVTGRDEYDWHHSNPMFGGDYPPGLVETLIQEADEILAEVHERGAMGSKDANLFTLESALCTYKSWHRPNRRYPNVYNDLMHDRICAAEYSWPEIDFSVSWEARTKYLPSYLRLEDTLSDPGCVPVKQNHYLRTGQPIMMDIEHECFKNSFNDGVRNADGEPSRLRKFWRRK